MFRQKVYHSHTIRFVTLFDMNKKKMKPIGYTPSGCKLLCTNEYMLTILIIITANKTNST